MEKWDLSAQRTQNCWLLKSELNCSNSLIFTTKSHIREILFAVATCKKPTLMSKAHFKATKIKMHIVTLVFFFFVKNICIYPQISHSVKLSDV